MKLLLTSGGICNKSIENELKKLIGKETFKGTKLLFCTTAANYEGYDMSDWLVEDLMYFKNEGFQIDVCDINGISKENFLPRFEWADAFFFEGGNTQWLKECITKTGLQEELLRLLESRVWIGVSAGSTVVCPTIKNSIFDLYGENIEGYPKEGLNLIDFIFIPHLNNSEFPNINIENIMEASNNLEKKDIKDIYVVDDEGAVIVEDDEIRIASDGIWYKI